MPKVILVEQGGKGGGSAEPTAKNMRVVTSGKTVYNKGETFDATGFVFEADYYLGTMFWQTSEIKDTENISYEPTRQLTLDDSKVTFYYGDLTCEVTITVNELVVTPPTKTDYRWNETFNSAGMAVTLGGQAVTGYTMSLNGATLNNGDVLTKVDNDNPQVVTVTYQGMTGAFNINVKKAQINPASITFKDNITYSGSEVNVFNATYWNGLTTSYFTAGGTTKATNHSDTDYQMTLTPDANHEWTDGTSEAKSFAWSIKRADITVGLNPSTLAITGSNYSTGITSSVTGNSGNGAVSLSSTNIGSGAVKLSVSGNTITATGTNNVAVGETSVTVIVAQTTNYNSGTATLKVSATYWEWGSETAVGDAAWWAGLKSWAASATATQREACVGKKKKVSLSSAVLGANAASMLCIGADQDGTGTLTFQTEGTLPTQFAFGSNALWNGSTAQSHCNTFADKCSASASIKSVTKLTSSVQNGNQNNTADVKTTAKCWLPSDCEMGHIAGADNSTSKGYASSYSEWTEGISNPKAYKYYAVDITTGLTRRKKFAMDANGSLTTTTSWYWLRSRYCYTSGGVCGVFTGGGAIGYGYDTATGRLAPAFVIG